MPRTLTRRCSALLTLIAGVCPLVPLARAQEAPVQPPTESPRPRPEPRPVGPVTRPRLDPVQPGRPDLRRDAIPGLEDSDFRIVPAPLLSERTTLALRRGSMVKLPTGERAFIFHPDAEGRAERPMVLLGSQKLQQMEQVAADREEPPVFLLTGQVYVYYGINYLLPTAYSLVQPSGGGNEESEPAAPPPPEATDPQVQDLIKQLEAQRRGPKALERTSPGDGGGGRPAATEAERSKGLFPEGQALVRRRGRMVRGSAGEWEFVFDRGSAGDPALDRPMVLAPCLNLQRMEAIAAQKGDAASFEVSGQVRIYRGRNHLVPTLYQAYAENELEPRQ